MSLISVSAAVNNMKLSALCLLTVALAFVPLNSAKKERFYKPGVCPKPSTNIKDWNRLCMTRCYSDRHCRGSLKCCYNGCGSMCMTPQKDVSRPKSGSCPRPDGFGTCVHACSTDHDCEKNLKCCSNGCGTTCMKPASGGFKLKRGTCPRPNSFGTCISRCSTDYDCERNLICCFIGCGKICMKPVGKNSVTETRPGVCPPPLPHFTECKDECYEDSECGKNLKCCYSGSGLACMKPVRETKPGSCPRPSPHLAKCDDECFADSECKMNLKCCYSGCGYKCLCPVYGISKGLPIKG